MLYCSFSLKFLSDNNQVENMEREQTTFERIAYPLSIGLIVCGLAATYLLYKTQTEYRKAEKALVRSVDNLNAVFDESTETLRKVSKELKRIQEDERALVEYAGNGDW